MHAFFKGIGTKSFRRFSRAVARPLIGGLTGVALLVSFGGPTLARSTRCQQRCTSHRQLDIRGHAAHHMRRAKHRYAAPSRHPVRRAAAGFVPVQASILIDADTGRVLRQTNADAFAYPASLTKMMTLYLTFEALNQGRLRLDQRLSVSNEAAGQEPTKLRLKPGGTVGVGNLILALVTRSANDAAVVLAEGLAGSEAAFSNQMTAKAKELGMARTVYRNASGLPNREQHTTARDIAILALALHRDFPREYHYFSTRAFAFRGSTIFGHDHLLDSYPGADGIKTGFIRTSGFNLATSAERDGHRLIGVVLGGPSSRVRDRQMTSLLDGGFGEFSASDTTVAAAPQPPAHLVSVGARLAAYIAPVPEAEAAPLPKTGLGRGSMIASQYQSAPGAGAFNSAPSLPGPRPKILQRPPPVFPSPEANPSGSCRRPRPARTGSTARGC